MEKGIGDIPELICETFDYKRHNAGELSPLTLAYIGDTIFDLIIRTRVVERGNAPVKKLHASASNIVNATAQAKLVQLIMPKLTEDELKIYKRGKNAKSYTTAKNASIKDYKSATGFEALLGWLYLEGKMDRVFELVLPGIVEYEENIQ
jgi:ribonuclease-3 family protein